MDHYTLMLVVDAQSPVRRFQLAKKHVRQACGALAAGALLLALVAWDYTRVRADNAELGGLRIEVAEQREQLQLFEGTLTKANAELEAVRELERKVRIIANLPGAVGIGGEGVTELVPPLEYDADGEVELMPPAGVPIDPRQFGQGGRGEGPDSLEAMGPEETQREGLTTDAARHVRRLSGAAEGVSHRADQQADSLDELLAQLEDKQHRLASMPSIWPTRGWLTSRFGPRVSPFTGRRHLHAGIDVAARAGTAISAPARGRVASVGSSGPLGNSIKLDHGFGVRTIYGHTEKIFVKVGEEVQRGQKVAAVGSSGRSTGPHLHYSIQVNGKARDPLDYIFD